MYLESWEIVLKMKKPNINACRREIKWNIFVMTVRASAASCGQKCGRKDRYCPVFATVRSSLLWPGRPCMSGKSRASAVPAVREPSFLRAAICAAVFARIRRFQWVVRACRLRRRACGISTASSSKRAPITSTSSRRRRTRRPSSKVWQSP